MAGGVPYGFQGRDFAVSGLLGQYAEGASSAAWNRERSRYARSLVGPMSTTERLHAGLAVLEGTEVFLADFAEAWVTNRAVGQRLDSLNRKRAALLDQIQALVPEAAPQPVLAGTAEPDNALGRDPVHGAAQAIVRDLPARISDPAQYRPLAAFVASTIPKELRAAEHEPWALLGLDRPPRALAALTVLSEQLAAVLSERAFGDTPPAQVAKATRVMPRGKALARAAAMSTARAQRRHADALEALRARAAARGFRIDAVSRPEPNLHGATWPPARTVVIAHVGVAELDEVTAALAAALPELDLPDSSLLVVPVRQGIPLARYAVRLFPSGSAYPAPDEPAEWSNVLPPASPMPAVDAVEALRELSALNWLSSQRRTGTAVQDAADDAARRLDAAVARLEDLPADGVTAALRGEVAVIADRVQAELHDDTADPTFAHDMARGVQGEHTDAFARAALLFYLATEHDIDPAGAARLLQQLTENSD